MFKIIRVAGSFLSENYNDKYELVESVKKLERAGVHFVHFDIMDGKFVENKTYDHELVSFVQQNTNMMLDVHLMVKNPEKVIENYTKLGVDIISVHYESTTFEKLEETLKFIKSKTILAGVAINPETPAYKIKDLIKRGLVDVVLVMGVKPGKGGQEFIPGSAEKVAEVRSMDKNVYIEIDGGVNYRNAKILRKLGADILVSGKFLYSAKDMKKAVKTLRGRDYGTRIKEFFKKNND